MLRRPPLVPFLRAASWCLWIAGLALAVPAQSSNVLIVLVDDLGVDKISQYGVGPSPPPTPTVDMLAQEGVLFRNAWASPECSPTRALIQTGRYGFRTGVGAALIPQEFRGAPLWHEETTIPELLDAQRSGYAHGAFGKWHLSDRRNGGELGPNLAGWSHYAGTINGTQSYTSWKRTVNGVTAFSKIYNTTQTVDDTLAWIDSVPEPWVCYLAFPAAHTPLHNPPAHLHTYSLREPTPLMQYKAMVQAVDTELGRLLVGLGERRERTNVIFAGDNGTQVGLLEPPFPLNRGKGFVHQGGVHVPLVISGPAVASPGREVDAIVGLVDVFATVAEICGVDPNPRWVRTDSVSLLPYLRDPAQAPLRNTLLTEQFTGRPRSSPNAQYAIRDARYKLLFKWWWPFEEFYDLVEDPYEGRNLLGRPMTAVQEARYRALRTEVMALRNPTGATSTYGGLTCVGSNGRPEIDLAKDGPPTLGQAYEVGLWRGPSSAPALLLVGSSRTRFARGESLPFDLGSVGGGPGCFLYCSMDFVLPAVTDAGGHARVKIVLPSVPALEAGQIYHSWLAADRVTPTNPLGLVSSDGLALTPWPVP